MTAQLDLHIAAGHLSRLVESVPDQALKWPTPCEAYTVGDLLDHIDGFALAFAAAAAKRPLEGGGPSSADNLGDGWQARIPTDLTALADAWENPDAWTGMTRAGGVDLPGEVAGVVALDELVIHGWDLAKAIGQPAVFGGPELDAVFEMVQRLRADGIEGLFGPPIPVDDGAPLLDRIVGLAGRDPAWRPPG